MKKLQIEFYFVFGNPKRSRPTIQSAQMEAFEHEHSTFDDFVIGDFVDSYNNLTLKTMTGHRFLNSEYFDSCHNRKWVMFHDDDSYIDYPQVNF